MQRRGDAALGENGQVVLAALGPWSLPHKGSSFNTLDCFSATLRRAERLSGTGRVGSARARSHHGGDGCGSNLRAVRPFSQCSRALRCAAEAKKRVLPSWYSKERFTGGLEGFFKV